MSAKRPQTARKKAMKALLLKQISRSEYGMICGGRAFIDKSDIWFGNYRDDGKWPRRGLHAD